MNFKTYIIDRIPYIVVYYLGIIFTVMTMQLDKIISGKALSSENILYVFFTVSIFLILFIIIDYSKKKKTYSVLNSIAYSDDGLKEVFKASESTNREHSFIIKILADSYSRYEDRLIKYKDRQKEHLHFINQWVHQMKTPVSVINLTLQSSGGALNEMQVESMAEEVEKLSKGLEMVLYTARISDFEMDFKIEKVDLLSVSRSVINEHKKELIRYSIYPKLSGDEGALVETDGKWIRFVINQIVTNSIKYSKNIDRDKKELFINLCVKNGVTALSIKDEGVGIPVEDLPRVFNPFFTGSNGREFPESTGMGMYLSKTVCKKLGHDISIKSERGKWTEVLLKFYPGRSIFSIED